MANANITAVITADDKASGVIKGVGDNVADTAKKIGAGMVVAGAGLTLFAKNATDFTKDLVGNTKTLSRETGETVESSSRLLYVTNRMGVTAEEASRSFGIFSKKIVESNSETALAAQKQANLQTKIEKTQLEIKLTTDEINKNGDATGELGIKVKSLQNEFNDLQTQVKESTTSFSKLGISTVDAEGKQKSFRNVLLEVADKFKEMPNGVDKTVMAMDLFGRSGKDMIKTLNLGSEGIAALEKKADEMGLTLTSKTVGAFTKYIQSQKDLTDSTNATKIAIGTMTAPVLTEFNQRFNDIIQNIMRTDGPLKTFTANVLAFGGPVLAAGGTVLGLGANIAQLGKETIISAGKFGVIGIAIAAAIGVITYLGVAVNDTNTKQGNATAGLLTWQAAVMAQISPVSNFALQMVTLNSVINGVKIAQDALKAAHDATTLSMQNAKLATDQLTTANLSKVGADLAVEQAQRAYNNAVAQYGPTSLEARQASQNLAVAQDNVKTATTNAAKATEYKTATDKEAAKDHGVEARMAAQKRAAEDSAGGWNRAADAVTNFITQLLGIPAEVNHPQPAGGHGASGGFATGGYTGRGGVNDVAGVVHKGEYVIPKTAVDQSTGMPKVDLGGQATPSQIVNITIQAGAFMSDQQDARKYARLIMKAWDDAQSMGTA